MLYIAFGVFALIIFVVNLILRLNYLLILVSKSDELLKDQVEPKETWQFMEGIF